MLGKNYMEGFGIGNTLGLGLKFDGFPFCCLGVAFRWDER